MGAGHLTRRPTSSFIASCVDYKTGKPVKDVSLIVFPTPSHLSSKQNKLIICAVNPFVPEVCAVNPFVFYKKHFEAQVIIILQEIKVRLF
ncbi:hypothetical protein LR48_Vigan04g169700 [Vigna angularis]|uniref:Uncharacterized protein n=1 Tax=Phaseolus angularis TaxID=3914 RepID=A0A0L9UG33_PHAAN|nr:hypothetical protein LR48_Vigan04g169700 [Vigna angularis]